MSLIVIVVGAAVLIWNYAYGDMVTAWYDEYVGPNGEIEGSGKWCYAMGSQFSTFAFFFSPCVYLCSIPSAIMLLKSAFPVISVARTVVYCGMSLSNIILVGWFLRLGIWKSVSQF